MIDQQTTFSNEALNKFRQWHFWWLVVIAAMFMGFFIGIVRVGLSQNNGEFQNNIDFPQIKGQVSGMKAIFEITDSDYLNIALQSSIPIEAAIRSAPKVVSVVIQSNTVSPVQLTFSGFAPSKMYYRYDNSFKNETIFNTDSAGSFSFIQDLSQGHHIWIQESKGTIFIPADCNTVGMFNSLTSTCTLNQDLNTNIEITDNGTTLDCNNHKLSDGFRWTSFAILLNNKQNVTVKNCVIKNATNAINASFSNNNIFTNNDVSGNETGFGILSSDNNTISNNKTSADTQGIALGSFSDGNNITNNNISDLLFGVTIGDHANSNKIESNTITGHSSTGVHITALSSSNQILNNNIANNPFGIFILQSNGTAVIDNTIHNNQNGIAVGALSFGTKVFHNNFINNTTQAQAFTASSFDNGLPDGGNFWNNYDTSAEGCSDADNNKICDAPFVFTGGQDNFPWTLQDGWKGPSILPVINFLQNDPRWATTSYDFTPNNIKELGCALTSAAMVLHFHSVTTTPDTLEPTNPKTLNRWLNDFEGYELVPLRNRGSLRFWKLPQYSKNVVELLQGIDVGFGFTEIQVKQKIDSDLASGNPVIVKTEYQFQGSIATTSHFVVIKGKVGDTYAINDPLSSASLTLEDRNYPILGIRRIKKSNGIPSSRLTLTGASPVQLFLTDPSNRKSGFNPLTQQIVFNIPSSSYYEDRVDDDTEGNAQTGPVKVLDIISPENGQYMLEVIGEGLGTYTIIANVADSLGVFREVSVVGITNIGTISSFLINVSSVPDMALVITKEATIQSTRDDIINAFTLGLINNQGIVNSLIKKLDNAETSLKKGNTRSVLSILNAFKNEVKAQSGKHITKEIEDILSGDIDFIVQTTAQNLAYKPLYILANFLESISHKILNVVSKFVSYVLSLPREILTLFFKDMPAESPTPTAKEELPEYSNWNVYKNKDPYFKLYYLQEWVLSGRGFRPLGSEEPSSDKPLSYLNEKFYFDLIYWDTLDNSETENLDFEQKLSYYASLTCQADGPGGSTHCPQKSIELEKFNNAYGLTGFKITRRHIFNASDGSKEEWNDFVVFYRFPEDKQYAGLLFGAGDPRPEYLGIMFKIANTVQF